MIAEFEEKQFETHLNFELLEGINLFYAPGQYLENILGFDAALMTNHKNFWRIFPPFWHSHHRGLLIDRIWWDDLAEDIEHFPKIKFNAFIQHKRPEYMVRSDAKEWNHWSLPYFRFYIVNHQQEALHELEQRIGNKGIVVYASPAFYKLKDLWDRIKSKNLVDHTNFCQANKLNNHGCYSYIRAGNIGKAHSETDDIESFNFIEKLRALSELKPYESNKIAIVELGNILHNIMIEINFFSVLYRNIIEHYEKYQLGKFALSVFRINAFRFLNRTSLLFGY
jgi:hypothetical protein